MQPPALVLPPFQIGRVVVTCQPPPDNASDLHRYSRFLLERRTAGSAQSLVLADCRRKVWHCQGLVEKGAVAGVVEGGVEDGFISVTLVKVSYRVHSGFFFLVAPAR